MWEQDHIEDWVPKNWCLQIMVLEKTLENPLDCKEIKLVNPKEDQPWIFIRKIDTEAEASVLWPPDVKSRLVDKDWCCERLRAVEGDDRGWDGWMASPTPWTWVWVNSRRRWRTEKPGVLQSMESQKVRHGLVSEQRTRTISMPLGFQETEMKQ